MFRTETANTTDAKPSNAALFQKEHGARAFIQPKFNLNEADNEQKSSITKNSKDLKADRFRGNHRLEEVHDNEKFIRKGTTGLHIEKIQQGIIDLGFDLSKFGMDGIFGSETERGIIDFQRKFDLQDDGVIGEETMGTLDDIHHSNNQPVLNKKPISCGDTNINQDVDPNPAPIPKWDVKFVPGKQMKEVFKRPEVAKANVNNVSHEGVFGLTVPVEPVETWRDQAYTVGTEKTNEANCTKCTANWNLTKTPTVRSFIAIDWVFLNEIGLWNNDENRGGFECPTSPKGAMVRTPVVLALDSNAIGKILFSEMEHYLDFVRAFRLTSIRHLSNIKRLSRDKSHLVAGNPMECQFKVAQFLANHSFNSTDPGVAISLFGNRAKMGEMHDATFLDSFKQSQKVRDEGGLHGLGKVNPANHLKAFKPRERFDCNFHRRTTEDSFTLSGKTSEDVIKDLNLPPKRSWHQF